MAIYHTVLQTFHISFNVQLLTALKGKVSRMLAPDLFTNCPIFVKILPQNLKNVVFVAEPEEESG